jgi:hypothetical protein
MESKNFKADCKKCSINCYRQQGFRGKNEAKFGAANLACIELFGLLICAPCRVQIAGLEKPQQRRVAGLAG